MENKHVLYKVCRLTLYTPVDTDKSALIRHILESFRCSSCV